MITKEMITASEKQLANAMTTCCVEQLESIRHDDLLVIFPMVRPLPKTWIWTRTGKD